MPESSRVVDVRARDRLDVLLVPKHFLKVVEYLMAGTLVPDIAVADAVEGDEFPESARGANLLDDADALFRCPAGSGERDLKLRVLGLGKERCHCSVLGVYFLILIDTKRLARVVCGCKQKTLRIFGWEAWIRFLPFSHFWLDGNLA